MSNENAFTTSAKPKSRDAHGPAQVIDSVDVPMNDGNFYEVKLVAGTGVQRNVKVKPTQIVTVRATGVRVTIMTENFDPAIYAVDAPAPVAAPVAPVAPVAAPVEPEAPTAPALSQDYQDVNVDTFMEIILETSDKATLDAMEVFERDNKGRKTVLRAIVDRREELG